MTTYRADLIADYFLARANPEYGDLLSNLKLQKLCYYAAGMAAAVRQNDSDPLFAEPIEAWQHGPVVPVEYYRFRHHGGGEIPHIENADFDGIEPHDRLILDDVYNYYGQYSAWKLRNMTHEERPWIDAFARDDKTIYTNELREYFSNEVTSDYINSYKDAQQRFQKTVR
jgi:uncharacterized phage-associated protein